MYSKNILLIGGSTLAKEFSAGLQNAGAMVATATDNKQAFAMSESFRPDAMVLVMPVYSESAAEFVTSIRSHKAFATIPIIYLGNFIESSDNIILQRLGVRTLTLGPVPTTEAVRFILSLA